MARSLRVQFEGALYHAMNRGIDRRLLFRSERDYQRFELNLEESLELHQVELFAYALMSNHFHLLVRTPRANLDRFMQGLQTRYAVYFNRKYNKKGHVMQGPYTAVLVSEDEHLLRLSRYLHLNPVKTSAFKDKPHAAKVKALRKYRWSSYPDYIGRKKPRAWIEQGVLKGEVEAWCGNQVGGYRKYVESGLLEDDEEVTEMVRSAPLAWGAERFVQDMADRYQTLVDQAPRKKEDIRHRRVGPAVAPAVVLRELCAGLAIGDSELMQRRGGGGYRGIAAILLIKYSGLTQREAARHLGVATGAAVSLAAKAAANRLVKECRLRGSVQRIEKKLMSMGH